ncbi:MAG: RNA-binding cell elongation regulator Jag/EloR [Chloroflexota bacterium]
MNERATLEKIAPTVEEAIAEGLAELGLTEDAVDVEVLDSGSRGLLGIGGRQARVRLSVKAAPSAGPGTGQPDLAVRPAGEGGDALSLARQIVAEMLEKMNINASIEARYGEPEENGELPVLIDINGSDLGVLIGRHAEILNAMQYLVNLMVSKQLERWVQVVIDVEGYRARRERQLRQLARRMADQAVNTGRRQSLEPMPANERRIIHLELRDHPSVTTQSVGEEPVRKVTIVLK